jgi:hypothetical protein
VEERMKLEFASDLPFALAAFMYHLAEYAG